MFQYHKNGKMLIKCPFLINYKEDADLGLQSSNGIYMNDEIIASSYSIYRREYDIYQKPGTKVRGYFKNGEFYYTEYDAVKITPHNGYIYIDIPSNHSYEYDRGDLFPRRRADVRQRRRGGDPLSAGRV